MLSIDAAIGTRGHVREIHRLLMIGAVVVHDGQQRDAVMRRRPQHARRVVQVAVALNIHRQAAMLAIRQRRAHRRRRAVADAVSAVSAEVLIVLLEIPHPQRPTAEKRIDVGHQ